MRIPPIVGGRKSASAFRRPVLAEVIATDGDVRGLLRLAAALLAGSEHVLADAVRDYAEALDVPWIAADDRRVLSGRVEARIDGAVLSLAPLDAADDVLPEARCRWAQAGQPAWSLRQGEFLLGVVAAEWIATPGNPAARPAVSLSAAQ